VAVLDPFCGTGTIVREALEEGRSAIGADLSRQAVAAARANLPPGTPLLVADAAALPLQAGTAGAVVTNPPFGRQHALQADPARWLRTVYAELERVVAPGGAIVLLQPASPAFEAAVVRPRRDRLRSRHPIELLGLRTTIWTFRR
jgi:tRNA G10  N-methylase Trm11